MSGTFYDKVIEDLDFLSDRISTQVRTISVGLIVLVWGLLVGGDGPTSVVPVGLERHLLHIGSFALLAMVLDYFQYAVGYWDTKRLCSEMEAAETKEGEYDYTTVLYRFRDALFFSKQAALLVAILLFIIGLLT